MNFFTAVDSGLYRLYGRMIAYFLCHEGPPPVFFARNLYNLVVKGIDLYDPELSDVEPDLRSSLRKV